MIFVTRPACAAMLAVAPVAAASAPAEAQPDTHRWSDAWTATVMRPSDRPFLPTWAEQGIDHQSERQVIRLSASGSQPRIRLSNAYATTPLRLTGASIGRTNERAAVSAGTIHPPRFNHSDSVTIPANGKAVSDPVHLRVKPRERVKVTLYFDGPTGPATLSEAAM